MSSGFIFRCLRCSDRAFILMLGVLAALRVGLYATLFPFGANVDEVEHYDVVVRWSMGQPPRGFDTIAPATATELASIASPEFDSASPAADAPPPARMAEPQRGVSLSARMLSVRARFNHELLQPPLYYAAAGAWRAGWQALGVPPGCLAFGVRLLNVLIIFGTVLVAGSFARRAFPCDRFNRLAVPALVAVMPQDAFYCVNNDVLSALLVGGALVLLADLAPPGGASIRRAAAAGALIACAVMAKLPNAMVMLPLAGSALICARRAHRAGWPGWDVLVLTVLVLATFTPLAVWMYRNVLVFGDLTGGAATARASGWTPKPVFALLDHPLLAPATMAEFLMDIVRTTWRGELVWHGARLALPWVDGLYVITTAIALTGALLATVQLLRHGSNGPGQALLSSWLAVFAGVGFLVFISMAWDFGTWFYPSRASPMLSSGRLILGALVPLATLFVAGLDAWARMARAPWARGVIALALCGISLVSELIVTWPVWSSPWNVFHLF